MQNPWDSNFFAPNKSSASTKRRFSLPHSPPQPVPPIGYDPNSTYSKFLLHQQQQQQSQLQQIQKKQRQLAQNQENFSNFMRMCNYSGIDLNTDLNNNNESFLFPATMSNASTSDSYSISSSQSSLSSHPTLFTNTSIHTSSSAPKLSPPAQQLIQQQLNLSRRRCSFGPNMSSQLHPLFETPSSPASPLLPTSSFDQTTQLSQLFLGATAESKPMRSSTVSVASTVTTDHSITTAARLRAISTGSGSIMSSSPPTPSFDYSRLIFSDPSEEKLATTGNIFERREDWSVLSRIPIAKQNTIHIRLEDEGPYGNDETRCFVLSHFSSLGIKQLSCMFCSCDLIVYDRFPLIDGTLFLSPVMYDSKKSIGATVANKHQYINAICLGCLLGESNHDIICKFCMKSMQSLSGYSIQIGTLYKYDLFAAFPCCKKRLTCKKCGHTMADIDTAESFSSYTEERECPSCKTRDYHFIKPLSEIFMPSKCQKNAN